jgi:5-oxoprolinase (ATP-hydrolysing)
MQAICDKINAKSGRSAMSVEECALGFVRIANAQMCRPIRSLTEAKGYAAKAHALACFGGAGGQHACAIARDLGMDTVFVHRYAGILSAYGIGVADVVKDSSVPLGGTPLMTPDENLHDDVLDNIDGRVASLWAESKPSETEHVDCELFLNLRYDGTDTAMMILLEDVASTPRSVREFDFVSSFKKQYLREYGFLLENRSILVDDVRIRAVIRTPEPRVTARPAASSGIRGALLTETHTCVFDGVGRVPTAVYDLGRLPEGDLAGPAVLIDPTCTILVEPNCTATVLSDGSVKLTLHSTAKVVAEDLSIADPIQLAVFSHRFMAIAEQMGKTLQRTSISTNIKERLDFSCALFDHDGTSRMHNYPRVFGG